MMSVFFWDFSSRQFEAMLETIRTLFDVLNSWASSPYGEWLEILGDILSEIEVFKRKKSEYLQFFSDFPIFSKYS